MTDTSRPAIPATIREGRATAILRGVHPQITGAIVDALVEGGITAVEVTLNSKDPFATIEHLQRRTHGAPLLIGAGTVLDREAAKASVAAGAAFLVAPNTDPELIRWAA